MWYLFLGQNIFRQNKRSIRIHLSDAPSSMFNYHVQRFTLHYYVHVLHNPSRISSHCVCRILSTKPESNYVCSSQDSKAPCRNILCLTLTSTFL